MRLAGGVLVAGLGLAVSGCDRPSESSSGVPAGPRVPPAASVAAPAPCVAPAVSAPVPAERAARARAIETVFLIVMENRDFSAIKGNRDAPFINSLLAEGAHAENYHNVPKGTLHPSEPNYIWLEAGDTLGFVSDAPPGPKNCARGRDHLTRQLDAAGIDWRSYQEDMKPGACPLTNHGKYAPKHDPMVFFDDVSGKDCRDEQAANCLAHIFPYQDFARALEEGTIGRYNLLIPNLCNIMHDDCGPGPVQQGDDWLRREIPRIRASRAYREGGAIFITWDEGFTGNQPIGMIVLSPFAKVGYANRTPYSHSSTLRTLQTIFGLSPPLGDAANAEALGDLFTRFP
ncbi:MAG: phosphoesterase [Sorangiineae bacterium]|nr:phosphoesterase [Polyangiaceae bacterium]MEB2321328.1 phosphoesterase [Sorangiineae bacterium]